MIWRASHRVLATHHPAADDQRSCSCYLNPGTGLVHGFQSRPKAWKLTWTRSQKYCKSWISKSCVSAQATDTQDLWAAMALVNDPGIRRLRTRSTIAVAALVAQPQRITVLNSSHYGSLQLSRIGPIHSLGSCLELVPLLVLLAVFSGTNATHGSMTGTTWNSPRFA